MKFILYQINSLCKCLNYSSLTSRSFNCHVALGNVHSAYQAKIIFTNFFRSFSHELFRRIVPNGRNRKHPMNFLWICNTSSTAVQIIKQVLLQETNRVCKYVHGRQTPSVYIWYCSFLGKFLSKQTNRILV